MYGIKIPAQLKLAKNSNEILTLYGSIFIYLQNYIIFIARALHISNILNKIGHRHRIK